MSGAVAYGAAFAAGVVSFLSPCVLPLVPGYLSFITGFGVSELERSPRLSKVLVPSLLFIAGFTFVFVGLGASASMLGSVLNRFREPLTLVGGALVFVMGFLMLGIVKVPWLYGEARFDMSKAGTFGKWTAIVMGMAFAFGWTPCVGPILASILALAGSTAELTKGATLLFTYAMGLATPFLAVALLFGKVRGALRAVTKYAVVLNRTGGVLLMVIGALIVTGKLAAVSAFMLEVFSFLGGV